MNTFHWSKSRDDPSKFFCPFFIGSLFQAMKSGWCFANPLKWVRLSILCVFNPSEKYARQFGSFPKIFEMKIPKMFELPPPRYLSGGKFWPWAKPRPIIGHMPPRLASKSKGGGLGGAEGRAVGPALMEGVQLQKIPWDLPNPLRKIP